MKISATVAYDEADFEIIPPKEGEALWVGRRIGDDTNSNYITFKREENVITDLKVNKDIDTAWGVILERLVELFRKQEETQQMGFEADLSGNTETVNVQVNPYDPQRIKVRPLILSVFEASRDIDKKNIDLNPEFQRNFVWDDTRKSLLIESMLLRIPLPAFYFAEDKKGKFQVVDGLQRLTVINDFLNNKFRLKNLEYLKECEGKYFQVEPSRGIDEKKVLDEFYVSRIEKTQLSINVIEASSPLRVKYDIFYRINTGGRPLNAQEIRNCFATTRIRELLKRMANNPKFYQATGGSISDARMDGQEISLRFLGFWFFKKDYSGNMRQFLDDTLEKLDEIDANLLEEAERCFFESLDLAVHFFGRYAFRKCLPQHIGPGKRKQFINKAMFVVWTNILARLEDPNAYRNDKEELAGILAEELKEDYDLYEALTTGTSDRANLEYVFERFEYILNNYLNGPL